MVTPLVFAYSWRKYTCDIFIETVLTPIVMLQTSVSQWRLLLPPGGVWRTSGGAGGIGVFLGAFVSLQQTTRQVVETCIY